MRVDHHEVFYAPPGDILPAQDYPEEDAAVENTPDAQTPRKGADAVEYDWRDPVSRKQRRVGNAEAAGRRCRTPESPDGVSGHQYRRMVSKPPVTFKAPPGPIQVRGAMLMDPNTRQYLYDLDEVTAWNAGRPGRGKRGKWRSRQGRAEGEAGLVSSAAG